MRTVCMLDSNLGICLPRLVDAYGHLEVGAETGSEQSHQELPSTEEMQVRI